MYLHCVFYFAEPELNIQCKMAMFSSKMDVNSFEIGNQTYRSMNPMFSKIKNSRYIIPCGQQLFTSKKVVRLASKKNGNCQKKFRFY
jgi:hypothetical protein